MPRFSPIVPLCTDFYKTDHIRQYPKGTSVVYATWIARSTYLPEVKKVVAFGLQVFIKEWLINYFDEEFFEVDIDEIEYQYKRTLKNALGIDASFDHFRQLHELGYLPIRIRAVPEGTRVPLRVPIFTIENTLPEFFWLTNFLETLISCEFWQPLTSATIAYEYRQLLDYWAIKTTGSTDGVNFQAHDFSMRGMEGIWAATKSGMGHLLSFTGTDTVPAILAAEHFYHANSDIELVGASIPATEHSVMCAGGKENEKETFRRLMEDIYPSGFFSGVADSWDLWNVVKPKTGILAQLHESIMERSGRVVIRPDSGDPVDIICGDDQRYTESYKDEYGYIEERIVTHSEPGTPEYKGVIECLWDEFGGTVNNLGYKVLDPHVGAIYGDSINLDRAKRICERLAAKGFASTNIVFGVGSFTYQYQTRDTFGQAQKATDVEIDGVEIAIFKDPITDKGHVKKSLTGRVIVVQNKDGELVAFDHLTKGLQEIFEEDDLLQDVFVNGVLVRDETFSDIRARLGGVK